MYNAVDPRRRRYVLSCILEPKRIHLDPENRTLVYRPITGLEKLVAIQIRTPSVLELATRLIKLNAALRQETDWVHFADLVEAGVSQIDRFECQDNLNTAHEVALVRESYLHELIEITRKAEVVAKPSYRRLSSTLFKAFALHIYLRQQMAGDAFRCDPPESLRTHPHPYVRDVVATEAISRKCLIRTVGNFVFIISPPSDSSHNPFSIRRFLSEEVSPGGLAVYVSCVVIPLSDLDHPGQRKLVEVNLARLVTVYHPLRPDAQTEFDKIEQAYRQAVSPMLTRGLQSDGADIEVAVRDRLLKYERDLGIRVLSRFAQTILKKGMSTEERILLLAGFRALVIEALDDVGAFNLLPAASYSAASEQLELKFNAYLKLFDRRRSEWVSASFAPLAAAVPGHQLAFDQLVSATEAALQELSTLEPERRAAAERAAKPPSRLQSLISRFREPRAGPGPVELLDQRIDRVKSAYTLGLIRLFKRFKGVCLFLELEGLATIRNGQRRYALAAGHQGLGRLPLLLTLPEDRARVDIQALSDAIRFDPLDPIWVGDQAE